MRQHLTPPLAAHSMSPQMVDCTVSPPPVAVKLAGAVEHRLLSNFGTIESVNLPENWRGFDRGYVELGSRVFLQLNSPVNPAISLKLAVRTRQISLRSASAFDQLIRRKTGWRRAEILLPCEIRSMLEVFSNVGLNQFVMPDQYAFRISHAAAVMVNGRTLLEVHGEFVNRDVKAISHYRGCFWDIDGLGTIQEAFVEGPLEE